MVVHWKDGDVLCFRVPQRQLHHDLVKATQGLEQICIENLALSDHQGFKTLWRPMSHRDRSDGSLERYRVRDQACQSEEVQATTLDHYFYHRGIYPDWIKIDAEGHELKILEGGIQLLQFHHPTLIIEIEQRHCKGSIFDTFSLMEQLGYQGYFFLKGTLHALSEFNLDRHQLKPLASNSLRGYVNNFVFKI